MIIFNKLQTVILYFKTSKNMPVLSNAKTYSNKMKK